MPPPVVYEICINRAYSWMRLRFRAWLATRPGDAHESVSTPFATPVLRTPPAPPGIY